jgi:hypothetical protein
MRFSQRTADEPTPAPDRASISDVTFNFVSREGGPERLVCEAELVLPHAAGILAGLKLVGFSLWRSPDGEIYVTFPLRAFGAGQERRFFRATITSLTSGCSKTSRKADRTTCEPPRPPT